MRTYWLSWYSKHADYRPVEYPPPEPVIGWWKTGETGTEPVHATIVAWVAADSEEQAKEIIREAWDEKPDARWRFCRVQSNAELSDRWQIADWMKPRIEKARAATCDS